MSGCMALCRALQWNAGGRRAQGCEGQGGRARMDRDTERMKETRRKKVRQLRKKKRREAIVYDFYHYKSGACRAAGTVRTSGIVSVLDAMPHKQWWNRQPQPEWGCCFQGGSRKWGSKTPPSSLPHPPTHPPLPPHTLILDGAVCFWDVLRGRSQPLKGREDGDESSAGGGATKAAAAAAYVSQCTQRTGHLIYIEPHRFLMQCGVRCGSRERSPTIKSPDVMEAGEYGWPLAAHAEPCEVRACLKPT